MNDADAIALVTEMVGIPSVSGDERRLVEHLVERLSCLGFDARRDAVGNLVARIGSGGGVTGVLLGHVDTVPGDLPVRVEGGRLHGRGSVDAKGPLAAFLAAAHRAHAHGRLAGEVVVIGCVEEEVASSRGARHVALEPAPDYCIVGEPGGWEGVTLGYKGYLRCDLIFENDLAHGAHAAATASERACAGWEGLRAAAVAFDQGRETLFDRLMCRLLRMRCASDGRRESAALEIALRLPPDLGPTAARSWVEERVPDARCEFLGAMPAWSGPRTTPLHRVLARAILERGGRPRYQRKTGTADLNVVAPAWGCPALAYGPGDAALDHTPAEHLVLSEFVTAIDVLDATLTACGTAFP